MVILKVYFLVVPPIMISAVIAPGQQTPVATDEEPHHHVLFRNESVVVIRSTLESGESTLYHTHSHDSAGFEFVASTTTEQLFGKPEGPAETSRPGEVSADSVNEPTAHQCITWATVGWTFSIWNCFAGPHSPPSGRGTHSS
jgi:hypothetical protein